MYKDGNRLYFAHARIFDKLASRLHGYKFSNKVAFFGFCEQYGNYFKMTEFQILYTLRFEEYCTTFLKMAASCGSRLKANYFHNKDNRAQEPLDLQFWRENIRHFTGIR